MSSIQPLRTIKTLFKKKSNLYEFYINDSKKNDEEYMFKDNKVDTKKYNIITFLPKALFYQFVRVANIYFLVCAILQCIPAISPLGAETAIKNKIMNQQKFMWMCNGSKLKVGN